MRDRLIELLSSKSCWGNDCDEGGCGKCGKIGLPTDDIVILADHLLANGVVVPPCKVGDSIFRCCEERNQIWEWQIAVMIVYPEQIFYVDDSENEFSVDDIGKTVFLSREEAEAKLKGETK